MYPLLISAASTIASKLIDNWNTAKESKAATSTENFAALLEKNAASASTAASARETQIAALRQKLLDSPEVSTLIATADPSKQPTLTLGTDGTLTAQASDRRTTTLHLSPGTAATARELATLTASSTATRLETAGQTQVKSTAKTSA